MRKQQKKKKSKKKQRSLAEKFVYMVFMAIVFIIVLMMIFMGYIIYSSTLEDKGFALESAVLSSGMAIIGVAIAVWAGLNIMQVLEKDKFELFSKEVVNYRYERKMLNKTRFLENVASQKDELSRYLYDKLQASIDEENDEIPSEIYFDLDIIETMFHSAYREQLEIYRTIPLKYYDEAIDKCEEQIKQIHRILNTDDFIEQYLKICIIEFNFYKGYIAEAEESRKCFQNVIKGFYEIFKELKEPEKLIKEKRYIDQNFYFTIFLLNSVGESYSKIIHSFYGDNKNGDKMKEYMREQASKGKECYETLFLMIESAEKLPVDYKRRILREVYYRNYGALLERISRIVENTIETQFNYNSKIHEMYQMAMDITMNEYTDNVTFKPFRRWLFFYKSVIEINNVKGLLEGNLLKNDSVTDLKSYTNKAYYYVKIALRKFPIKILFMKFQIFIERDLTIWGIYDNNLDAAYLHAENLKLLIGEICIIEEGAEILNTIANETSEKNPKNDTEEELSYDFLKEMIEDSNMLQKKIYELKARRKKR